MTGKKKELAEVGNKTKKSIITEIKGKILKDNTINRVNALERSRRMRKNEKCLLDLGKRNSG